MADTATDVNVDSEEALADLGAALLEESPSIEDSSTEEPKKTDEVAEEPTDKPAEKPADATEEDTEDDSAKSEDEADSEEQETPKRDAEARKQQLNQEIRQLVAEKKQRQAEVEALNAQVYRTESVDELVENGMEPEEAALEAQRQEHEMERFNRDVTDLNQAIDVQVAQVMQDFTWSDPESPDYDANVAQAAFELLNKAGQPQIDEKTGFITNINVMPYEIYQAFDATRRASAQNGAVEGRKASAKMLASVEPRSSAPVASSDEDDDPFMAGFNKVI